MRNCILWHTRELMGESETLKDTLLDCSELIFTRHGGSFIFPIIFSLRSREFSEVFSSVAKLFFIMESIIVFLKIVLSCIWRNIVGNFGKIQGRY